jgi:hypothetical protein
LIALVALVLSVAPGSTSATALERLTKEIVRPLEPPSGFEGPVGVYVEGSPAPTSRAIASLVMAALARQKLAPVPVDAKDATEAERLAREQGLRTLLRLTVSFEAPRLTVRGDALSTWVNFWSGQTATRSGPAAAIAASVDADLEAVTLVGSPTTPSTRPLELVMGVVARAPGWPSAFAIADVDGDKKGEVIALIDDTLTTWSADGKLRSRVELQGALSVHPTREPFGFVAFTAGRLQAWSSRRERAETFTWDRGGFRAAGASDALTLGALTLTPRPGFASFARELQWAGKSVVWPEPLQSIATFGPIALGVGAAGTAGIARGTAPSTLLSGVGAGSTLADFDGDGTPEVIVSGARMTPDGDEVRVLSLGAFESAQVRSGSIVETSATWSRKVDGRVILAGNGDLDGDGIDEVILVSWLADGTSEFSLLRRAP